MLQKKKIHNKSRLKYGTHTTENIFKGKDAGLELVIVLIAVAADGEIQVNIHYNRLYFNTYNFFFKCTHTVNINISVPVE